MVPSTSTTTFSSSTSTTTTPAGPNMLTGMIRDHMARQHLRKEQQEKRKNEAIVAAHSLTEAVVEHLNARVSHAYNLQKRLDVECKKLEQQSAALARHADAWTGLVGDVNQALKEIGDVDSWARAIEEDVQICAGTLERVYEGNVDEEKTKTASACSSDREEKKK